MFPIRIPAHPRCRRSEQNCSTCGRKVVDMIREGAADLGLHGTPAEHGSPTPTAPLLSKPGHQCYRPPGAPCGSWPRASWIQSVFHDPYERINVWSHGAPGVAFLILGLSSYVGVLDNAGQQWVHNPLGIFCFCAACTHLGSMLTHIYPDSHTLEKLDHLGIVALVVGTPVTALMAHEHGEMPFDVKVCFALMLAAAFFPPSPRVAGFSIGTVVMIGMHWRTIFDANLATQLCLYGLGALCFLRAKLWEPNLKRWQGFYDHHLLHYLVTTACLLHIGYIRAATRHAERTATV